MNSLQNQIATALKQSGMSKADLARRLKCDPSYISHLLNGKQNLTVKSLSGIAQAMGHKLTITFNKE